MKASDNTDFRVEDGVARIVGDLTLDTVGGLFERARRADGGGIRVVELGEVRRVDSSGLALLLEWEAGRGGDVEIRDAPDDLLRLARLCGAQDLLHIAGRERNDDHETDNT